MNQEELNKNSEMETKMKAEREATIKAERARVSAITSILLKSSMSKA